MALAGNSVVWRGLPDLVVAALVRLLRLIPDWLPVVATALTGLVAADLSLLGHLFEWLLFSYLLYRLFPRLLPDEAPAGPVFAERRFRLLAVAISVALALPIAAVVPSAFRPSLPDAVALASAPWVPLGVLVAAAVAVTSYVYVRWWRHATPDEKLAFAAAAVGHEPTAERLTAELATLERDDWAATLDSGLLLFGSAGRVVLVCGMLGLVAAFAGMLFPLVEVVVVAGVAAGLVAERFPERVGRRLAPLVDRTTGVEERFYAAAGYATSSPKGMVTSLFVVFGFLLSTFLAVWSVVALVVAAYLAVAVVRQPAAASGILVGLWNALGLLTCVSLPGVYSVWFWRRMATRLPHFLAHWEARRPGTASVADPTVGRALVTRPPLALAPAFLPWLPVLAVFRAGDANAVLSTPALALAWPALVLGVLWTVRWTRRTTPQPPGTDAWALPTAMAVQIGCLELIGWTVPGFPFGSGGALGAFGLLVTLLYVPDARSWLRRQRGLGPGLAMLLVAGTAGVVVATAGLLVPGVALGRVAVAVGSTLVVVSVVGYAVLWAAGER